MALSMESKLDSLMLLLCPFFSAVESTWNLLFAEMPAEHFCIHSSWQTRLRVIYRATKQHAFNLAKFVSIYKTVLLIQKKLNSGKERDSDTFIAGLLGGYVVFGDRNAVNEQVCPMKFSILVHSQQLFEF